MERHHATTFADTTPRLDELRRELLDRAFLFDDPTTYEAGVEDTLTALRELAEDRPDEQPAAVR